MNCLWCSSLVSLLLYSSISFTPLSAVSLTTFKSLIFSLASKKATFIGQEEGGSSRNEELILILLKNEFVSCETKKSSSFLDNAFSSSTLHLYFLFFSSSKFRFRAFAILNFVISGTVSSKKLNATASSLRYQK
uniref:Uncharacterized protein n=1 Tax=Cacopsylla melanoneura TaxID=428564 RepID=A0A8D8M9K0_9HEMI